MDFHLDGQAGPQREVGRRRHRNAQRHALGYFDERAGNAFGRDQAELGIGGAQNLRHAALEMQSGIGVDGDFRLIADGDLVKILLLDVGIHA